MSSWRDPFNRFPILQRFLCVRLLLLLYTYFRLHLALTLGDNKTNNNNIIIIIISALLYSCSVFSMSNLQHISSHTLQRQLSCCFFTVFLRSLFVVDRFRPYNFSLLMLIRFAFSEKFLTQRPITTFWVFETLLRQRRSQKNPMHWYMSMRTQIHQNT